MLLDQTEDETKMNFLLNFVFYVFVIVLIAFISIYAYFLHSYRYWASKKVPYLEPKFPYGHCRSIWSKIRGYPVELLESCHTEMRKRGWKYGGFFTLARPTLLVLDPEYARDILTKDFHHFVDRGFYYQKGNHIAANLFVTDERDWKNVRSELTPTFTSGKMKMMFPLIINASKQMTAFLDGMAERSQDINIRECLAMFTTDVIVSCGFGLESNCFTDENHLFRHMGKQHFTFESLTQTAQASLMSYAPDVALKLNIPSIKKEIAQFFVNIIGSTIKYRKDQHVTREDFLQLMIHLLDNMKNSKNPFTFEQVVAQVTIFFIAGFETSASTMTFALYELARNPDFQDKLREEIFTTLKHDEEPTYESIKEMKYLEQIVEETLRLYPVVSNIQRKCIKDYTLRDTDIVIEKGVPIVIPLVDIQRDPEYFEDPLKFDPQRFSPENKAKIVPFTYLPFGVGPRNCVGLRFGLMQTKIGLIQILRKFRLKISQSTKMPVQLDKERFILQPMDTLYLQVENL